MSTRELPIVILPAEGQHLFNDATKGYLLSSGHALPALWPDRSCGTCTLCCSVMAVHEDGVDTKYGEDCVHLRKRRGCAIYETRPGVCKAWSCLWRLGILPEDMRPDKVHAILEVQSPPDDKAIVVHVQPKHRHVWRSGIVREFIKGVRTSLLAVIVVCGNERWLIGDRWQYQIEPEMPNPDGTKQPMIDHLLPDNEL